MSHAPEREDGPGGLPAGGRGSAAGGPRRTRKGRGPARVTLSEALPHRSEALPCAEKACRRRGGACRSGKGRGRFTRAGAHDGRLSPRAARPPPRETSAVKSTTNGPFARQGRAATNTPRRKNASRNSRFFTRTCVWRNLSKHLPLCCRETIERGRRDHHRRQCRHHCPGPLPGPHRAGACDERSRASRGAQAFPAGPTSRHPGGQLRTHRPPAPGHRGHQGLGAAARVPAVDAGDRSGGRALQHLLRRAPAHGAGAQGFPAP